MANKRKREADNVVPDCLSKAADATFQTFEATVTQIQAKKSNTGDEITSLPHWQIIDYFFKSKLVDTVARRIKETRRHCEAFTGEKMIAMEKCMSQSNGIECALLEVSKSASNFSLKIGQMEKRLKEFSKFITQVDQDTKNELQNFDSKS